MPFSLNDRVLYGLLAVEEGELALVLAGMLRIETDPIGASDGAAYDRRGRLVYAANFGRCWLYYWINRVGKVYFVEILAEPMEN